MLVTSVINAKLGIAMVLYLASKITGRLLYMHTYTHTCTHSQRNLYWIPL
jgi:hypothetical protein